MARRLVDVEDFVDMARECLAEGDHYHAVEYARQACAMAPLRPDLREFLACVLGAAPASAQARPVVAPRAKVPSAPAEPPEMQDPSPSVSRFFSWAGLGARDAAPDPDVSMERVEEDDGEEEEDGGRQGFMDRIMERVSALTQKWTEDTEETGEAPVASPANLASRTATRAVTADDVDESDGSCVSYAQIQDALRRHVQSRLQQDEPQAAPSPPRRRRRPVLPPIPPREELSRPEPEPEDEYAWSFELPEAMARLCGRVSPQMAVYGAILLFIMVSSTFSYVRFFRHGAGRKAVQTAKAGGNTVTLSGDSSGVPADVSQSDEGVYRLANDYIGRKRFDEAIALLESAPSSGKAHDAARADQLCAKAYDGKASMLLENNKLLQAVESYKKAVELDPNKSLYSLHLGNAYYFCGTMLDESSARSHLDQATAALNRAIELDRNNVVAYQRLATVYESLKKASDARAAWTQIIQIAPDSSEAQLAEKRIQTLSMAH